MSTPELNWIDRLALSVSPSWGQSRLRARMVSNVMVRHYEAASSGRRTQNWNRTTADANSANGPALSTLRGHARDLVRNNPWARNGLRVICDNTIGWGITAKALGVPADAPVARAWKAWAESKDCDVEGRLNFYGVQKLALRTTVEAGEVLIRRVPSRVAKLALPFQLQVLEPDMLDTSRTNATGQAGGSIIHGVEFDAFGRRVAYWIFDEHPGSSIMGGTVSRRVPASEIIHSFFAERPGQVRGVSWFAPAIVPLKDFDEFEDAELMRQKIAACFAAFVVDVDGSGSPMGEQDDANPLVETVEPGLVSYLRPGQDVRFSSPPMTTDSGYSQRVLRRISAAMGVTYEDLTGDYSQVNYSSARMSKIRHWAHVNDWRWNMLIPQVCEGVWAWAMDAAFIAGLTNETPAAEWTDSPMPMLDPAKEGLAFTRLVRAGAMTPSQMVRERGYDPATHWDEYKADQDALDARGIWLDSDVRRTSQAGLTQERAGGKAEKVEAEAEESEDEND